MSGVSLLASRLKLDPVWTSRETVKLSDSIASSANIVTPESDIRAQIEFLISQTNAQERALLRYHAELSRRVEEIDTLKCTVISKNGLKLLYRTFNQWKTHVTAIPKEISTTDTTLRNLALSLTSPLRPHDNEMNISTTSTVRSVAAMPFQTVRIRPTNSSFSLNSSRKLM